MLVGDDGEFQVVFLEYVHGGGEKGDVVVGAGFGAEVVYYFFPVFFPDVFPVEFGEVGIGQTRVATEEEEIPYPVDGGIRDVGVDDFLDLGVGEVFSFHGVAVGYGDAGVGIGADQLEAHGLVDVGFDVFVDAVDAGLLVAFVPDVVVEEDDVFSCKVPEVLY